MNSESWRQVEELYHAALEQHPAQRGAFLAERAASEEVRREVISLLDRATPVRECWTVPRGIAAAIETMPPMTAGRSFIRDCNLAPIFSRPAWEPAAWVWSTAHGTRS